MGRIKLASGLLRHGQPCQGGGTYVTGALQASFLDPWQAMVGSYPNFARRCSGVAPHVGKGQAAEWAAERATDADLLRLTQAFEQMQKVADAPEIATRAAADIAFHQAIGEAAHNALIAHLSAAVLRLMRDSIELNLGELKDVAAAGRLLASQHAALYSAICERKPQAARAAAETHIDFVRETLAQTLRSVARRETAERRLAVEFRE